MLPDEYTECRACGFPILAGRRLCRTCWNFGADELGIDPNSDEAFRREDDLVHIAIESF